ncbi:MerR family transcriptional regulator [Ammoniphilus sp. CFH 90114]|uniref:MerR family transcriptional regulator n=1 Tax=Ammoniphilus sp. CFH 90114 TaxID=2493665 RepID=UPI00100E20D6|nr:MerR family transcriptional regulator [Ammoniphilus sp. CFH 90114]RXT05670.1 MerR family transcriptional regulator [Ammoniphilus sp. CFH 90114]
MNTGQLYSLKEMAKEMDTTWQSIRSWKEQYYQFVPMETAGKQVWFKPEAVEVFQFIKEAKEKGLDHHAIRSELFQISGQADDEDAQETVETDAVPVDMVMVKREQLEEMQETIQALQKEVNELKEKWAEVEIAKRDQTLMDNLRDIRDKKKKGLWSRVMNFTL